MIHDFSVWLRTESNPADINGFRIQTGKKITKYCPILSKKAFSNSIK